MTAMLVSLTLRTPFKVNVVRDPGVMARIVAGGKIENVYRLQVMNATEAPQHYKITVSGLPGLLVTSDNVLRGHRAPFAEGPCATFTQIYISGRQVGEKPCRY